jgi:signal transduction histidine kinase
MPDNKSKPTTHFKTNVLLKSIIGKDLINNDNVAVLELIKNSFDAGSPSSVVTFKNILSNDDAKQKNYSNKTSKIIVADFGRGMDKADIEEKWLNIAYSEKKNLKEEAGRILAGAKGVGRFSCDRLGEFLDIYSKKNGKSIVHLKIDWKDFELEDKKDIKEIEIQDIPVDVKNISDANFAKTGHKFSTTGTIIEISKLRTNWDNDKIKKLRHYLERLLNPNQSFDKKKFSINLIAKEFDKSVNGEIKNQIFDKLDFTTTSIESFISKDGKEITTNLKDKGRDVFTIVEKNHFSLLKDVKIVVYFLNTYSKIYFARETGRRSIEFGSIFLFKNGFRVSPYGEEGDDWLKLEMRKGQGQRRFLGTRDIVGRIEINDPKGEFQEVSSREGLVENEPFKQLTNKKEGYFIDTLKRLEKFVVDGLQWDRVPESMLDRIGDKDFQKGLNVKREEYLISQDDKDKSILDSINSIIRTKPEDTIDLFVNTELIASLIKDERGKVEKIIEDFEKYGESKLNAKTFKVLLNLKEKILKEKEKELVTAKKKISSLRKNLKQAESQNLFYQSSINVDVKELLTLHHDIGICAGTIDNYLNLINTKLKKGKEVTPADLEKYIKSISYEVNKISTIVNFATKANFNDASDSMKSNLVQFVKEYLENVVKEVIKTINNKQLKLKVKGADDFEFKTSFIPMEIMIIVDNLFKNSAKAEATEVEVSFQPIGKEKLKISFKDNGNGISNRNRDKIFDFGFTTTDGSGLGLYHVNNIISKMGGKIEVNNELQNGVELNLIFPK